MKSASLLTETLSPAFRDKGVYEPLEALAVRKIRLGNVEGYEQDVSTGP
jgi:hypothetical protein